ncbi:MAG: toluene tolerance protein [Proteobacteria bacterium]|nr:MAG: toluene tolerance protein [Pseudomonadota bacterium]
MSPISVRAAAADPNEYYLSGQLVYDNAQASLKVGARLFEKGEQLTLDFTDVARVDTAGVAVLLAWTRLSKKNNQSLSIRSLPKQALALIENSGLSGLMPLV